MSLPPTFPSATPRLLVRYYALNYRRASHLASQAVTTEAKALFVQSAAEALYNAVLWRAARNHLIDESVIVPRQRYRRDLGT